MLARTRRVIAGAGLAAGLLIGSVAPAAALPATPTDEHCERIERFEARAQDRIDRIGERIDRFEARIERFESRAQARPERAERWTRRIERLRTRVERFETRIERITDRYDALAAHCGVDPLFPGDEDPAAG